MLAGGLLFCFEDMASFWNISLGWQIFFACMMAVFSRAFMESLSEGETLGLFTNTIAYETTRQVDNAHTIMSLPAHLLYEQSSSIHSYRSTSLLS